MPEISFRCGICFAEGNFDEILVKEMMFGTKTGYSYLLCRNCGTLQIKDPVTEPALLYPGTYYSLQKAGGIIFKVKEKIFRQIVKFQLGLPSFMGYFFNRISPFTIQAAKHYIRKDSRILDVGCGKGELLGILSGIGFNNLEGIDPFISEDILEKGYSIYKSFPDNFKPAQPYDVIMLNHSFEHMENPDSFLKVVRGWLKSSGVLIIRIPVADSYSFEHFREHWMQIDAPRHIFLHTTMGIRLLAERNNWQVLEIIDDSLYYHLVGSEQYKRGISVPEKGSFFPLMKSWIFPWTTVFSRKEINAFSTLVHQLNARGIGDQRAYVLKRKD